MIYRFDMTCPKEPPLINGYFVGFFAVGKNFNEQTAVSCVLPGVDSRRSNALYHWELQRRIHSMERRRLQLCYNSSGFVVILRLLMRVVGYVVF